MAVLELLASEVMSSEPKAEKARSDFRDKVAKGGADRFDYLAASPNLN